MVFQKTALELQPGATLYFAFTETVFGSSFHPVRIRLRFDHLIPCSYCYGILGLLGATIMEVST